MKQHILTFHNFENVLFQEQEFVLPEGHKKLIIDYSMISPGTELFCINEAIKSDSIVQPGYIAIGSDQSGKRFFLFPSISESSACHCNVRAVSPESLLLPLPPEISLEKSGFLRFINIGLHAINQPKKLPKSVCVIGLGPVGNMAAQTAGLLGCKVTGVDTGSKRRKIARSCNILDVIAPEQLTAYEKTFDLVIDTVATSSTLLSATTILRNFGECVMVGIIKNGKLKASDIFLEAWQRGLIFRSGWEMLNPLKRQLDNVAVSTEENLYRALNWIKNDMYIFNPLLTGIVPAEISQIKSAYKMLKDCPSENMCFLIKW